MWHDFGINLWNRRGYNIDMTIKNGDLMGFIQQTMVIQPTKMELLVGITKKNHPVRWGEEDPGAIQATLFDVTFSVFFFVFAGFDLEP
jgi:hypothetical protein